MNLFGNNYDRNVRCLKDKEVHVRFTKKIFKQGHANIMIWVCFSWDVAGEIHRITSIMTKKLKSLLSSRQCVGLLDEKLGFELQARYQNRIRKIFLRRFPLNRFLAKTLRENKNCHEKFLKKSVVRGQNLKTMGPGT